MGGWNVKETLKTGQNEGNWTIHHKISTLSKKLLFIMNKPNKLVSVYPDNHHNFVID